jgi:hypothetical protein
MEAALKLLENRSAFILETGTASHGTNSTILFDSYVSTFGGTVITVDSRLTPLLKTKDSCSSSTRFYCNDSIKLIKKLVRSGTKVDLIYLDSLDLDLNTPVDSALHALGEFLACVPLLKQGTILLVDDTPSSLDAWVKAQGSERVDLFQTFFDLYNLHPGKGMLIKQYVENLSLGELILHQYQMLYKIR